MNSQKTTEPFKSYKSTNEPTFDLFISGDLQRIQIGVVGSEKMLFKYTCFKIEVKSPYFTTFYSYRRYNEFYALYKALKLRYENLDFPPFPPKIQIFNRVESRKAAFHLLLNKVLEIAIKHYQAQKTLTLLKTLYAFLTKNIAGIKPKSSGTFINTNKEEKESNKSSDLKIPNEHKETFDSNDDSDEENNEYIDKFSKILMIPEVAEEMNMSTEKESIKPRNKAETEIKKQENIEEVKKNRTETEENFIRPNGSKKVTILDDTNSIKLERSEPNNDTPKINNSMTQSLESNPVPKRLSSKKERSEQKAKENYDLRVMMKTKFYNLTNNSKVLQTFFGNKANNNKNDCKEKNKIIDDDIFDCFNFYENQIPNFNGNIWVKFKNERKWSLFYGKIIDSNLLLFSSILENNFNVLISMYGANIDIIEYFEDLQFIEVYHNYDRDKTLISVDSPNQRFQKKDFTNNNGCTSPQASIKDKKVLLQRWYKQLKLCSEKTINMEFENYKFRPIGKTLISIIEAKNIRGLGSNTTVFVRIKHVPYLFKTKKVLSAENPKWKQSFLMPISDHFFSIKFEIFTSVNDGLFTEHQKEELYGSCEILVSNFLNKYTSSEKHIELKIEIPEQKKKKIMEKSTKTNNENSGEQNPNNNDASIIVYMKNLSHAKSWFAKEHPFFIEGKFINKSVVDKKELKMGFSRVKRIVANCKVQIHQINEVFRFKYPKISYISLIISILVVLTADMNNFLSYFVLIIMLLIIFNFPQISSKTNEFIKKFNLDSLNPEFIEPEIETISQFESKKFKDIDRLFVKLKDNESILTKFRGLKKSIAQVQWIITTICNFLEKTKNLLLWKDPQKTTYFIILMFIIYVFVSRIPIRFFILLGGFFFSWLYNFVLVLDKFYCGKIYYRRIYELNERISTTVIRYIIAKYYPDFLKPFDQDLKWPQNIHTNSFFKKLTEQLVSLLSLEITEARISKTEKPSELIKLLTNVSVLLKPTIDQNDLPLKHILKKVKRRKTSTMILKKITNFIFNIPSDYYRVLHKEQKEPEQLKN